MMRQGTKMISSGRNKIPLYGLVLAGGKSMRMKKDKSLLAYHGKSQIKYCFDLLLEFCEKVFVSNRKEQSKFSGYKNFPQIHDTFSDVGPAGGMLSAMTRYPNVAWFVLACDLPFVNNDAIETLIKKRNTSKIATVYESIHGGLPEPLCAIYEPKSFLQLSQFLADGYHCPRKFLIKSDIQLVHQQGRNILQNINDPEEYITASETLQSMRKDFHPLTRKLKL